MSSVVVAGNTSGSVTLDAPAVSGSTVITLPTVSGTMAASDTNGTLTVNCSTAVANALVLQRNGGTDTNTALQFKGATTSYYIGRKTDGSLGFAYNTADVTGSSAMTLDASGNLYVGTSSQFGVGKVSISYLGSTQQGLNLRDGTNTSGSAFAVFGTSAGATLGTITNNANTGVLYNTSSDYRLKDNPQPLTGAKEFILALQPKTWDWKADGSKGVGFIAHEFMDVAKYSGNGEKDAVDAEGNPVYQSIQPSSSEVIANLVSFIQEQQALITSLTARLDALENK